MVGWAAGIFEGEGCITFTSKNSVAISVNMTDEDVILRFQEAVGCGHLNKPVLRPGIKIMYGWATASKAEVLTVLDLIQPYLGERRTAKAIGARRRLESCRDQGFCHRGHRIAGENLYCSPKGQRHCRECMRMRDRVRRKSNAKA